MVVARSEDGTRETGKARFFVTLLPSVTEAESTVITVAPSSLRIVPVAAAVPSVAFTGADNVTEKVSFGSRVASPQTVTEILVEVLPAGMLTVPPVLMKSIPELQDAPPVAWPLPERLDNV